MFYITRYHLSKQYFMILLSYHELGNGHFVIFILDIVDIYAIIKVSRDLTQVALEISFVHAKHGKATVL